MKNSINIFSETGCIPHEALWRYRQGKLTAAEKHAVEVHLTDCELCSDALAGMMSMETDEMMAGLRESVRKISAPKKVIRFYDYRVLTAAAAVVAIVFVFAYVINSSNKEGTKEIAQLVPPAEPKKNEQPPVVNLEKAPLETKSTLTAKESYRNKEKTESNNGNMAIVSNGIRTPSLPVTKENFSLTQDADKQEETTVAKDDSREDVTAAETATGYTAPAPAQTAAGESSRSEERALASSSTKNQMRKKSATNNEPSKITYMNNLKVSRTPAMTEDEKLDTIVNAGVPAMYQNAESKASEPMARELPFVYSKTLRDGMNYFQNKQYPEASQTFSIILERFPNDVNSQFYKGLSEMNVQNYSGSSALLNKAMLNTDRTFYEEAKFKLALCYIAMNQEKDAEKLLREIKAEKGFYSGKAAEELEQLK